MTTEKVIKILRLKNLLANSVKCSSCSLNMFERRRSRIDTICWVCYNKDCPGYKNTCSIRTGSFLEDFRLPLSDILTIVILWSEGRQLKDIIKEYGYSKKALISVIEKLRDIAINYFATSGIRLGGPGSLCQIDETLLAHKRKYNRGRVPSEEIWAFGIADTSYTPARCYIEIVPDRSASTLLPIISKICKPGTEIHSDGWKAYYNISKLGYAHEIVVHETNFVDPVTRAHTQHIESFWNKIKISIKAMKGISKRQIRGIIAELMFRDWFKENAFLSIVCLMRVFDK